ncbi:MAG TPA: TonB-dependent receptor, partial [Burkholderiaceae bacterium]
MPALLFCTFAQAEEAASPLQNVAVTASRTSQLGIADTANSGIVTQQQLAARTVYRPGELLEATPGLIVSQHSGEGKANQFYLRGFNLDHGTDFRTTVDGMPVNQRSHAHGQGWSDLNFLIPELASKLEYRKGPYYAAEGDFASAGAVALHYADKLATGIASLTAGQYGYRRGLLAASPAVANGHLLVALELFRNDGPFTRGDDFRKANGVLRYSAGDHANGWHAALMAYRATWNSTDQIPQRAVDSGRLGRFDAIDLSDGGSAHRYSMSAGWRRTGATSATRADIYAIHNDLQLFSNFTYFLDDPVNGDQFAQPDRRVTTGFNVRHTWQAGSDSENTLGLQGRNDNIHNGLYNTRERRVLSVTREDHIVESDVGLYFENATRWSPQFRTVLGARADHFRMKVASDLAANSGTARGTQVSPKLAAIWGPWQKTEFYFNAGHGFHSNDARGATIAIDPKSREPAERVAPLVRAKGLE